MQGAVGDLWGGWEHVKACLSESRGSGVKVPSSPAAEHEWIWGNVHEYSIECYLSLSTFFFFLLFFFLFPALSDFSLCYSNLPLALPPFIFLCLCLFFLAVVCLRTSSTLPQGVTSTPRSYLNLACPRDFWSLTKSFKKTSLYHRTPTVKH